MNIKLLLHYGNRSVLSAVASVPKDFWETKGACGVWSPKEILAHITSYEKLLHEVLESATHTVPTPLLDSLAKNPEEFNNYQVSQRNKFTPDEIISEYSTAYEQVTLAAQTIDDQLLSKPGTIPWYGKEYALDDYVVYSNYGHKMEHCAQIVQFVNSKKI
jgi:hypothetical protein